MRREKENNKPIDIINIYFFVNCSLVCDITIE